MTNEAPDATKSEAAKTPASKKKPARKRPSKKAKTVTAKTAATPAPEIPTKVVTIDDLAVAYLAHLATVGKAAGTIRSYASDLSLARKHFGGKTKLRSLTNRKVISFFTSDAVTKLRDGADKNRITVAKIRRVFRLALTWAVEAGQIDKTPIPSA